MTFQPALRRFLAAALTAAALPLAAETLFKQEAKEELHLRRDPETGRVITEQRKVRYHAFPLHRQGEEKPVIVRETVTTSEDEGLEGVRSTLKVDLYFGDAKRRYPSKPSHTITIPNAHEADYLDDHWRATTFGCCDAETYGRLYTYGGDKPFLRYNERYWKIWIPNADERSRYVGLALRDHVPNDTAREVLFGGHPKAIACLSLAAPGKPLDRVYLKPRAGVDWSMRGLHTERVEISSPAPNDVVRLDGHAGDGHPFIEMWSLDAAKEPNRNKTAMSGAMVTASVYLDDGTTELLRVEIEDDRFVRPKVEGKLLEAEADER